MRQLDAHPARSATIPDSFGAFGLTRPSSAAEFAMMPVHEFQHAKLSGLLDLIRLSGPGSTELHFAPWRTDPRPVSGLLQGVYAFLGIADLWRRLAAAPGLGMQADQEFALAREQVRWGLDGLAESSALTAAGRDFTAGMRRAFDDMATVGLPKDAVRRAEEKLRDTRDRWMRHNSTVLDTKSERAAT